MGVGWQLLEIQSKHKVIPRGGFVLDLGCAPGAWLQALGPPACGGAVVGVDTKADVYEVAPSQLLKLAPAGFTTVLSDMCPSTSGTAADVALSVTLGERALELAAGALALDAHDLGPERNHSHSRSHSSCHHPYAHSQNDAAASFRDRAGKDLRREEAEGKGDSDDGVGGGGGGEGGSSSGGGGAGLLAPGGALVVKLLEGAGTQEFARLCKVHFMTVGWLRPKATRPASREIYLIAKGRL
eukprot:jgi/Mesen1/5279/ME000263S04391